MCRQRLYYGYYRLIKVTARFKKGQAVKFSHYLKSQTVVSEDYKRNQGAAHPENICPQNNLLYGPAAADTAHKERGRHAPYHPVRPEKYGPVLREAAGSERVSPGAQPDKILEHISDRRKSRFYDVARFFAEDQHIKQQRPEQEHTYVSQP